MPIQMTPAEARIVDPILTSHAIGYQEPTFTGHGVIPLCGRDPAWWQDCRL